MHRSAVVTQFTISCAVELLRLLTSDDIMTSLLKKLSILIKIHAMFSFKIVVRIRGSRCELVANCVYSADATQLDSFVASAVCIGLKCVCDVINNSDYDDDIAQS